MRGSIYGVMALVAVCALPSLGQAQQRQITHVQLRNAPVARLPYTAEYKTTHVKTLADGSTITQVRHKTSIPILVVRGRKKE